MSRLLPTLLLVACLPGLAPAGEPRLRRKIESAGMTDLGPLALSPDGRFLAAAASWLSHGEDHRIRVWDVSTGQLVHTLRGHTKGLVELSFSPDGKVLVS